MPCPFPVDKYIQFLTAYGLFLVLFGRFGLVGTVFKVHQQAERDSQDDNSAKQENLLQGLYQDRL